MSASARISQYERSKHVPDLGTLSRIAAVLNLPVTYFYSVEDHEAELVERCRRMPEMAKKKVLELVDELAGAS